MYRRFFRPQINIPTLLLIFPHTPALKPPSFIYLTQHYNTTVSLTKQNTTQHYFFLYFFGGELVMMNTSRNRFPFTPSQWQELEHQALIFKYMASGIPVPPDLLFTVKRSCMDSKYFPRPPPHIGWSCFQMGLERKIDPEPGRCRRTDGKKWRCSKEAYPDSKYCERHMHRGKNRSRKPVEVANQTTNNTLTNPLLSSSNSSTTSTLSHINKNSSSLLTSPSPSLSLLSPDQNYLHYTSGGFHGLTNQFLSSHASRSPVIALSPQDNNSHHLLLDNAVSCSLSNSDYRNRDVYGMKEEIGEHAFFSEPSGSMRNLSGTSIDEAWQLSPLTMSSSSSSNSKQRSSTSLHNEYSYLQLQTLNDHNASPKQQKQFQHSYASSIKEEEPQKTVHRFFDEWPPKNKDSWLDLDDKSSNNTSVSTTMLSISIPSSSHDFPIFNSRTHNDV